MENRCTRYIRLREGSWLDTGMQDRDVYYGDRGSRSSDRSRIATGIEDRGVSDRSIEDRYEDRGVSDQGVAIEDRVVFQVKGWRSI